MSYFGFNKGSVMDLSNELQQKILAKLGLVDWRRAAVLVPYFIENNEAHLIFTQRTDVVEHHKGQICFPGGMQDHAEETLWETALRECEEEIGLNRDLISFVTELNPQITPTGFLVTPFVGHIQKPSQWNPNPSEIASIFSVPVSHLKDPQNSRFVTRTWENVEFFEPHFAYQHHDIWGMTGRVVCDFLEKISV